MPKAEVGNEGKESCGVNGRVSTLSHKGKKKASTNTVVEGDEYYISEDDDIAVFTINPKTQKHQVEFAKVESMRCMRAVRRGARKLVQTRRVHLDDPTGLFTLRFWESYKKRGTTSPLVTQPLQANYKIREYEASAVIGVVVMQPQRDPKTDQLKLAVNGDVLHACMNLDYKMAMSVLNSKK